MMVYVREDGHSSLVAEANDLQSRGKGSEKDVLVPVIRR
jgi:hypothetical protein